MASYIELYDIRNQQDVVRKATVAIVAVANDIIAPEAGATAARTTWATEAISNPGSKLPELINYILINNAGSTQQQIIEASDATYKAAVAAAVTKLIGATV